jgi:hypothetical protein
MLLVAILSGYLLAALHYAWRDRRRPIVSRPAYARGDILSLLLGGLGWLPATIFKVPYYRYHWGLLGESVVSWAVFGGAVVLIWQALKA